MLLANAGVRPPYVLVGHSLGGIHIRVYENLSVRCRRDGFSGFGASRSGESAAARNE